MARKIVRTVLIGVFVLLLLAAVTALVSPSIVRNSASKSFPDVDGDLQVPGLENNVEIFRDNFGVPHIFGDSHHDLFFAQGYVHAQDRFWQMDFWRHTGAGRLSELIGKPMLETDKFLRTLGWERVAKEELALMGSDDIAILEAYSDGVNTYISEITGTSLSLEYAFLPLTNPNYEPKTWVPLNSLTWGKAMAWDLRGNLDEEIDRAKLLKDLSVDQVDFLNPSYPSDHPLIVPNFKAENTSVQTSNPGMTISETLISSNDLSSLFNSIQNTISDLDSLTAGGFEGVGSILLLSSRGNLLQPRHYWLLRYILQQG